MGPCGPLAAEGAELIHAPVTERGVDLKAVLKELGRRGISRLMVEGGARVAASFIEADLADEVWLYRGPVTIGAEGVAALDGTPLTVVTQSPHFRIRATETLGRDVLTIYERV